MWVCAALYLCKLNIFGFLGLFVGQMLHMKKQPRVLGRGYYYFLIKKIQNNNLKRKKISLLKTKQSYITDSPMLCISRQFTELVVQISKLLFNLKNVPIVLKLDLLTSCLLSDHSGVWSEPKTHFSTTNIYRAASGRDVGAKSPASFHNFSRPPVNSVAQLSDIGFWARAGPGTARQDVGWFWHRGSQFLIG